MIQLIVFIIFAVSVTVVFFILLKKVPVLVSLPKHGHHGFKKHEAIAAIEKKIKQLHFHFFKKQMLLHKLLSWLKVWTLKMETRVDGLLRGIRKKAQELDREMRKKK